MQLIKSLKKFFLRFFKFCFFIFCFFILIKITYNFLSLKEIKIINEEKKYILGIADIKKIPLFFIDENKLKNILLKKNSQIKDLKIEKKYPNILIIEVIKDEPLAVLDTGYGYFYLGSQGKIIYKSKNRYEKKMPLINFYQKLNFQNYHPGEIINFKEIIYSLQLLEKINDYHIKINSLDIDSLGMILFYLEDKKVFFSSSKDFFYQWSLFEKIYRQFKIEGKQYKEIDLRFDKPIVRF